MDYFEINQEELFDLCFAQMPLFLLSDFAKKNVHKSESTGQI